uniref:UPAR/Ly6 domain-containing protein n=1 Tax=Oryzias latipes TaxID=8090 RepID=H2L9T1_ORYLA
FYRNVLFKVTVLCFVPTASSLTCRQCIIDIYGSCFLPKDVDYKVALYTRGCVGSSLCNISLPGTLLGAGYTGVYSCCTADLCNGATSVQLPLMAALLSGLLSSLWGFWQL